MSLERLKKNAERIIIGINVLNVITVVSVILQTVTLLWLTIMPNKFIKFFDKVRIYEFFVEDIDNVQFSLFELSTGIVAFLFLFVILSRAKEMFSKISNGDSVFTFSEALKRLSLYFFAEALFVPIVRVISSSVFIKDIPSIAAFDISSFVVALCLWFLSKMIETQSVEK